MILQKWKRSNSFLLIRSDTTSLIVPFFVNQKEQKKIRWTIDIVEVIFIVTHKYDLFNELNTHLQSVCYAQEYLLLQLFQFLMGT